MREQEKCLPVSRNLSVLLDTEEDFVYSIESKSGNRSERMEEIPGTERETGSFF